MLKMDSFDPSSWEYFLAALEERHHVDSLDNLQRYMLDVAAKLDFLDSKFRFIDLVENFWDSVILDNPDKYAKFKQDLLDIDLNSKLAEIRSRIPEDLLGIRQSQDPIKDVMDDKFFQYRLAVLLSSEQRQRIMNLVSDKSLVESSVPNSVGLLGRSVGWLKSRTPPSFLWFTTGFLAGALFTRLLSK